MKQCEICACDFMNCFVKVYVTLQIRFEYIIASRSVCFVPTHCNYLPQHVYFVVLHLITHEIFILSMTYMLYIS